MLGCSVPLPLRLEATRQVAGLPSKLSRVVLEFGRFVGVAVAVGVAVDVAGAVGVAIDVAVDVAGAVGVAVDVGVGVTRAAFGSKTIISSIEPTNFPLLKFSNVSRDVLEFAVKLKLTSIHWLIDALLLVYEGLVAIVCQLVLVMAKRKPPQLGATLCCSRRSFARTL